jgi:hypothetical protein
VTGSIAAMRSDSSLRVPINANVTVVGQGLLQAIVGVVAEPFAVKPNVVEAPAPSDAFHETLRTVAVEPLMLSVPFQSWLMVWPLARVQVVVQPLIAEDLAVTVTSPWKPPGQELTVWYEAVQAPVVGGGLDGGGLDGGGLDGGGLDGGGLDGGWLVPGRR